MTQFNKPSGRGISIWAYLLVIFLQTSYSSSNAQDNVPIFTHGILWRVQAPESNKISYLLGTVHTMDTNYIRLPLQTLERLADAADIICLESVDTNDIRQSGGKRSKDMVGLMMLKDTSRTILNSLDSSSLHQLFKIIDQSEGQVKWTKVMVPMIKPNVMAFMLQMELQTRSPLYKAYNFSPEAHFTGRAKALGKRLAGLETYGDGIKAVFHSENFDADIQILKAVIREYDNTNRSDLFINYWKQDLGAIGGEFIVEEHFVRRNQTMVASIDRLIEGSSLFVMVGAAHLPGENGVLNLLKEKGYTVKNIPVALETAE